MLRTLSFVASYPLCRPRSLTRRFLFMFRVHFGQVHPVWRHRLGENGQLQVRRLHSIRINEIDFSQFFSRWWPGRVYPLNEIPARHQKYQPKAGEFLVFFFGSKDSAFVYRGQVFHYQDGVSSFSTFPFVM